MKHRCLRLLALSLALLMLAPSLFACAKKEAPTTVNATEVIGKVGGIDVTYDELYFLITTYYDSIAEKHEGNIAGLRTALDALAREELIANPAIRLLCEQHGLNYSAAKLNDEVNNELDLILHNDFSGSEEAYRASMIESGITEHYLRYTTGLDILYGDLINVYPSEKLVITTPAAMRAYILENFICTYHIALFNDTPEEADSNLAKMQEAKAMLDSGEATMYQLIKGSKTVAGEKISLAGYNEDVSDISGAGNYLTRGTWDEAYEEAAFALKENETSDVVLGMGESPKTGKTVPTYYIIRRSTLDESYIDKNLSTLQDEYYASVIYTDLQEVRAGLTFEPNDFYRALDLANLLPVVEEETNTWAIVLCSVGGVLLIGGGLTVFFLIRRKRKKALLPK